MEPKTSKSKKSTINVQGTAITVLSQQDDDFMSLTDMLKAKDGDFFISDWLRNRNTVEFLGIWEQVHNPSFNYGEFAVIKSQVGLNSYKISVKEWAEKTNAIGLRATAGRYGGTYAHNDIAFEFGMWISPEFKIYLIKEFYLDLEGNMLDDADVTQLLLLANCQSVRFLVDTGASLVGISQDVASRAGLSRIK